MLLFWVWYVGTNGDHVHLFIVDEPNIFFKSDAILKVSQQDKSLKNTLRLKNSYVWWTLECWDYIGTVGDDAISNIIVNVLEYKFEFAINIY